VYTSYASDNIIKAHGNPIKIGEKKTLMRRKADANL